MKERIYYGYGNTDPNVNLVKEINDLWTSIIGKGYSRNNIYTGGSINGGLTARKVRDLQKGIYTGGCHGGSKKQIGGLGWGEMTLVNEFLYPLQPKLPSKDENNRPVPPSTPFDFLNF